MNLGGLYENAVAQQLYAHGFSLFFYNSHKQGELDFITEYNGTVLPIEVKSGKDYYVHSALDKALNNPEYEIEIAYIFANCNVEVKERKVYLPVYMSAFVEENLALPVLDPRI